MGEDRSLKSNVGAIDKIIDIRLSLRSDVGSKIVWILVEGEDDCKIYPKFFDETKASIEFVNGGKDQLIIALNTLTKETKQVIGIQDADFLHIDKNYPAVTNLFYTDYHDIEMTMLKEDIVWENLLAEYKLQGRLPEIQTNILNELQFISYIRYYNEINTMSINFKEIAFRVDIDSDSNIHIKIDDLINELNLRSPNKRNPVEERVINEFTRTNASLDIYQLGNGHDLIKLLTLRIKSAKNNLNIKTDNIAQSIRQIYRLADFQKTKLYFSICDWQAKHGYAILKNVA